MNTRLYKRLTLTMGFMLALGAITISFLFVVGEYLTKPAPRSVGQSPNDLDAESVKIPYGDSQHIAGWYRQGRLGAGVVLLTHGIRADRRQMLERAKFLSRNGYGLLLIDLPSHGESSGNRILFGAREHEGVTAAISFLERRSPGERIAIIGTSLGAASYLLSSNPNKASAAILESMYSTIEQATENRLTLHVGQFAKPLAPILLWQLEYRFGISPKALKPSAAIAAIQIPVLIASGKLDRHAIWKETEAIFANANAPKQLWAIENAAHVDLHAHDPKAYESKILEYLQRYLRNPTK